MSSKRSRRRSPAPAARGPSVQPAAGDGTVSLGLILVVVATAVMPLVGKRAIKTKPRIISGLWM